MQTSVVKFGGTSVGTTQKIQVIAEKLVKRKRQGESLVVVVSAMGKKTDELVDMAKAITPNPDKREMDMLLSTGEQVTIALMTMAIKSLGVKAISLTGGQARILTDTTHSKARIHNIDRENIESHLKEDHIVVVAGFQGITENGDITTLGRGGSDTTAVSLAAVLGAGCEIYTDVDGVYTIDPRKYPRAKKLKTIGYDEMLEMASLGAGVIDARAIEMGHKYKVPITIALNTMAVEGTLIKEVTPEMEKKAVTGMSLNENIIMVSVSQLPFNSKTVAEVFKEISNHHIIVDMISLTPPIAGNVSIAFTIDRDDLSELKTVLEALKEKNPTCRFSFNEELVMVSVVGVGMVSQSGVASRVFNIFADNDIHFYQVTTSEISISYTIHRDDFSLAIEKIAEAFDL